MRVVLISLLTAIPGWAEDQPIAQRWALKLLPEKLPELPAELYGPRRINTPPLTRGGNGFADALTFRKNEIVWTQTQFRQRMRNEKTRTLALRVEKSLLEYDDSLRTAALHDDTLVLNVAVPINERTFYLVHTERSTNESWRVNEWLFAFDADPRLGRDVKVTVEHASEQFPESRPRRFRVAAQGTVRDRKPQFTRLDLRSSERPGLRLPTLLIWPERPFLAMDEPNRGPIEYRRAPTNQP